MVIAELVVPAPDRILAEESTTQPWETQPLGTAAVLVGTAAVVATAVVVVDDGRPGMT